MKTFIGLFLISTALYARPHSVIDCSPIDGKGYSAKFKFDGFDDKYSTVSVFKDNKKLFSMNGDTTSNPCLEVDMSAGSDTENNYRDIIAVFTIHDMKDCPGPIRSARLGAYGSNRSSTLKGNLAINYKGQDLEERVKCIITEKN